MADESEAVLQVEGALPEAARSPHPGDERAAGFALRRQPLRAAADFSGDGRRRQGRRDQARHVRRQSAGLRGVQLQTAEREELEHDFLWRTTRCLPERGHIGIFNRSYYEEVLVVRVHPEILARAETAGRIARRTKNSGTSDTAPSWTWKSICIATARAIVKFFLHLSKEEQRRRFLERIDDPDKNWKFSQSDLAERRRWKDYMRAYEACLSATSTEATRRGTSCPPTTRKTPG